MKKRLVVPTPGKRSKRQIAAWLLKKHIKKPVSSAFGRIKKYYELAIEYIRLKSAHKITKKHFEIGKEDLELARKKAKKEHGSKFVEEFESHSREKEKRLKPMPRKAMEMQIFFMKRIKHNLLKLFHPIRTLRESRKTKIIFAENKKGKIRI